MKKTTYLYLVLFLMVALVVLNVGLAGDGHVEVVKENVTLEETNTTLTKQNQALTDENNQLTQKVEVLETTVDAYEKADSARNSHPVESWELTVPIK